MIPAGAIKRFQSTLPAREATSGSGQIMCPGRISIHASCKGSDHSAGWCRYPGQYFNPRFPRGKRPLSWLQPFLLPIFQSTLPAGEATTTSLASITDFIFQSTLPAGEATNTWGLHQYPTVISIHASRGGSDVLKWLTTLMPLISIHASRGGSDTPPSRMPFVLRISIHASRGGSDTSPLRTRKA